jgi:hypothetical protein
LEEIIFHQNKLKEALEQCFGTMGDVFKASKVKTEKDNGAIVGEVELPISNSKWLAHANELWVKTEVEYQ